MQAYEIVSDTLKLLASRAVIGITPEKLNNLANKRIIALDGVPYNKNYKPEWAVIPFPAAVCISVNDCLAHGIPTQIPLKYGDIVKFDLSVYKDKICGDAALTVIIGKAKERDKKMVWACKQALKIGIAKVKPGVRACDVGAVISQFLDKQGFVANRRLHGHGIGAEMHQGFFIPHYYDPEFNHVFTEGEMICIEPHITYKDKIGYADVTGWNYRTLDKNPGAAFEHQLKVTKTGVEVLTNHIN